MRLLLEVFYFITAKLDAVLKLKIMTGHILKQAKRIFGVLDFKYYALGDGISILFKRSIGKLSTPLITRHGCRAISSWIYVKKWGNFK